MIITTVNIKSGLNKLFKEFNNLNSKLIQKSNTDGAIDENEKWEQFIYNS